MIIFHFWDLASDRLLSFLKSLRLPSVRRQLHIQFDPKFEKHYVLVYHAEAAVALFVKRRCMAQIFYLRKGIVYLPTTATVRGSAGYMDIDPVAVVPALNRDELQNAIREALATENPQVPTPSRANYPELVVLKHAGVKSWSAFERGLSIWLVKEKEGTYRIYPYRKGAGRGLEEDSERIVSLPPGTRIEDVAELMVKMIQEKVRE